MKPDELRANAHRILSDYITGRSKMRNTPERNAILDVVLDMKGHHSADDVLAMMPETFHVSRVTVYSTLQLLTDIGIATAHQIGGATLYENAYGVAPHHHTVCLGCGKVTDVFDDELEQHIMNCKTKRFTKIIGSLYLYGYCNICQARLNKQKRLEEFERLANLSPDEKRIRSIGFELHRLAEEFKSMSKKTKN